MLTRKKRNLYVFIAISIVLVGILGIYFYRSLMFDPVTGYYGRSNNPALSNVTLDPGSHDEGPELPAGYYDVQPPSKNVVVGNYTLAKGQKVHNMLVRHKNAIRVSGGPSVKLTASHFDRPSTVGGITTITDTYGTWLGGTDLAAGKYWFEFKANDSKAELLLLYDNRSEAITVHEDKRTAITITRGSVLQVLSVAMIKHFQFTLRRR